MPRAAYTCNTRAGCAAKGTRRGLFEGVVALSDGKQWQDELGNWQPERRSGVDRRSLGRAESEQYKESRKAFRRKADRELYERDHKAMIKEALEDFAEEHGGHL